MTPYEQFLARKGAHAPPSGFDVDDRSLHPILFPFQRRIVRWALARGRAAVFADTGLGKTLMQLEWARRVWERTQRPVLILAPLAVAEQTVAEAALIDLPLDHTGVVYARRDVALDATIVVTNYEMLDHFDVSRYAGIVLDESSILKAYDGATRTRLIEAFRATPYRLCCTATPAPNDHMELGNHAEFLGVRTRAEMLSEFFVHDSGRTSQWRVKGHARDAFWRWVAQWAVMVRRPSDLGDDDTRHELPPLRVHEHVVEVDHADARAIGMLFLPEARTLSDQRKTRRATMDRRVALAASLAGGADPCVIWCELNAESEAVHHAIPGSVEITGSMDPEHKRSLLVAFARGEARVLVTKARIAGFGLNWQHCSRMIFLGVSHSHEQTYQAIRRCWRFGQRRPVDVHYLVAETERPVIGNLRRKQEEHEEMAAAMLDGMRGHQWANVTGQERERDAYTAPKVEVPGWLLSGG